MNARVRVKEALNKAKTVEEIEKEHYSRVLRILRAAQKAESIRALRKLSKVSKDYFPLYYKWLLSKDLLKIERSGYRRALRPVVTEKGLEALNFLSSGPLGKEIVFEMDGWAKGTVELKLKGPVEVWEAIKNIAFGPYHFLRFLSIASPSSNLEIKLEINPIIETLENEMWSYIVHSTIHQCPSEKEKWWHAIQYLQFKLPDFFDMPAELEQLKEGYSVYWKNRLNESVYWKNRLNESWVPSFLRELMPSEIDRFRDENKRSRLEEKLRWIRKQLDIDPNTFMPSPLWRSLGFEVRIVWPAKISLPFNVTVSEPKVFAFLISLHEILRSVQSRNFTLPFDTEGERFELFGKKVRGYLIGSPALFIEELRKLQRDPTFYEAWTVLLKIDETYRESVVFYPINRAYERYVSLGVFVDIARAYVDIWKNSSGKKNMREITLIIKKICHEISGGRYDYM